MRMMTRTKLAILFVLSSFLFACGSSDSTPATPSTTLEGVAGAGIFTTGIIKVYALKADGTPDTTVVLNKDTTLIKNDGSFKANIGSFKGAIVAVVFGSYTDEATNTPVTLLEGNPLRAALPSASIKQGVANKFNVTALTTVAVAKAEGTAAKLTDTSIPAANTSVAGAFNLTGTGITDVSPVKLTDLAVATVTDDQKKYTALLALLSEYAKNVQKDQVTALTELAAQIGPDSKIAKNTSDNLQAAAQSMLVNVNLAAIKDTPTAAAFVNTVINGTALGGGVPAFKAVSIHLRTVGVVPIGSINALKVTLPAGVILDPVSGVTLSGGAVTNTEIAKSVSGQVITISLANGSQNGLSAGEFLTIKGGYSSVTTLSAADFTAPIVDKIYGLQGDDITSSITIEIF